MTLVRFSCHFALYDLQDYHSDSLTARSDHQITTLHVQFNIWESVAVEIFSLTIFDKKQYSIKYINNDKSHNHVQLQVYNYLIII